MRKRKVADIFRREWPTLSSWCSPASSLRPGPTLTMSRWALDDMVALNSGCAAKSKGVYVPFTSCSAQVNECMEGVCKIYEEHLKRTNPNIPSITYDISQLFDFIDQVFRALCDRSTEWKLTNWVSRSYEVRQMTNGILWWWERQRISSNLCTTHTLRKVAQNKIPMVSHSACGSLLSGVSEVHQHIRSLQQGDHLL